MKQVRLRMKYRTNKTMTSGTMNESTARKIMRMLDDGSDDITDVEIIEP